MKTAPILYTQSGCAETAQVRTWLAQHDIAFRERNVSRDPRAAQDLVTTGIFATPLLVVGEDRVLGFRPEALARVLLNSSKCTPASRE